MRQAVKRGRAGLGRACGDAEKRQRRDQRDLLMAGRLREGLKGRGLVSFAQSIVELRSGRATQHSLLIRLRDSRGGIIGPGEFIPVAERFGLIPDVDRWAMRRGMELAGRGHAIHVNVSGATLADDRFGVDVERELGASGAAASNLIFEVTETALIGNERAALRFINRVRALGCRVAIDDFGSGYGGFHYIKRLSVDYLKDRPGVRCRPRDRWGQLQGRRCGRPARPRLPAEDRRGGGRGRG